MMIVFLLNRYIVTFKCFVKYTLHLNIKFKKVKKVFFLQLNKKPYKLITIKIA